MIELNKESWHTYKQIGELINKIKSDKIYIYSMLEGRQQGRIFVDNLDNIHNILFWHYCGFAYVVGDANDEEFNGDLISLLNGEYEENQRRFALAVTEEKWDNVINRHNQKGHIQCSERYQFKFNLTLFDVDKWKVQEEYELKKVDKVILEQLEGRIIPSFSWESNEAFLEQGQGLCLVHQGGIIANAFSAAIGNGQIDIGIETNLKYRGKGLGKVIAAQMVQAVLDKGFEPLWGCHTMNMGSVNIAKAVGFEIVGKHHMYML